MFQKNEACRNHDNKTLSRNSDSNYGSIMNQSSSSPSSLSITCSSMDYQPSTSGCSSDMAYNAMQKMKKKEKVKQYLKELRSMIPNQIGKNKKFGTLSTLQHVLNSMRKIKEEPMKEMTDEDMSQINNDNNVICEPLSISFQGEHWAVISTKKHTVEEVSSNLMQMLFYPKDFWKGRVITNFMTKKDMMTFNSNLMVASDQEEMKSGLIDPGIGLGGDVPFKRSFCIRFRYFKSLTTGFKLETHASFRPFEIKLSYQKNENAENDSTLDKNQINLRCIPLISPYKAAGILPEKVTFTTLHSRLCQFSYVHSNAIMLLGHLPQDINGSSIFDFYHPNDLIRLYEVHQQVLKSKGQSFESPTMRLKAWNGCWVEVQTKWSSFVNPWTKQLDFVIGHHTVVKGPANPDVFAEPEVVLKTPLSPSSLAAQQKMHVLIRNLLIQPVETCMSPPEICAPPPPKKLAPEPVPITKEEEEQQKQQQKQQQEKKNVQENQMTPPSIRDMNEQQEESSPSMTRDISAIYEQLNYSQNIKRYLMSQSVFPSAGGQFCIDLFYGDPISSNVAGINKDIVNLSFPKPKSLGSSTMVHVSEHREDTVHVSEHREDTMQSLQSELEPDLPRWNPPDDAPHVLLTEEALRKHTKLQERLLCEQAQNDKNIFIMDKAGENVNGRHSNQLKRTYSKMEWKLNNPTDEPKHGQTDAEKSAKSTVPKSYKPQLEYMNLVSQWTPTERQSQMQSDSYLQLPYKRFHMTSTAGFRQSVMKRTAHKNCTVQPNSHHTSTNAQWCQQRQTGESFAPQLVSGFYQPMIGMPQSFPMVPRYSRGVNMNRQFATGPSSQQSDVLRSSSEDINQRAADNKQTMKKKAEDSFATSSTDGFGSSLMYILEGASLQNSSREDIEQEIRKKRTKRRLKNNDPAWLHDVQWSENTKNQYRLPHRTVSNVLKADRDVMQTQATPDMIASQINELMQEMSPDEPMRDEEFAFLFIPSAEGADASDKSSCASEGSEGSVACAKHSHGLHSQLPSHVGREHHIPLKDQKIHKLLKNQSKVEKETEGLVECKSMLESWQNEQKLEFSFQCGHTGSSSSDDVTDSRKDSSSMSKGITDITPSDARSTEVAGSSIKESSVSGSTLVKDSSSESEADISTEETLYNKMFVSLPTKFASRRNGKPFWIDEVDMTETIEKRFQLKAMDLETVLMSDMRAMRDCKQPINMTQQMEESELKSAVHKQRRTIPDVVIDRSIFDNLFVPSGKVVKHPQQKHDDLMKVD